MEVMIGYAVLFTVSLSAYFYLRRKDWKYKKYLLALSVIGAVCLIAAGVEQLAPQSRELSSLKRNEAGQGANEVPLVLDAEDLFWQYDYSVSVEEQLLTEEEAEQIFEKAKQELETVMPGENRSLDAVSSDLSVPKQLLNGLVTVSCSFEPYDLVNMDGAILWENLTEKTGLVKVTAELSCQGRKAVYEFYIQLTPQPLEEDQALLAEIQKAIEKENKSQGQEYLKLPRQVNGIRLNWQNAEDGSHGKLLLLGLGAMAVWYVLQKEKQEREQKEWNRKLILDYPDIVSRLSLLTGAGMTVPAAWAKIALEYVDLKKRGRTGRRPGYEEMMITWHELQDGVGELTAYENFGRRCGQPQYRKFASMLMQNVRKGTRGMQQLLDAEAREAFQQRKAYARQMGEEAGTKLLIPMGLMLILVFAILMLPAMLSLRI